MNKITRALISVSDKTGIEDFAAALVDLGVEILSSGGTARTLEAAGGPGYLAELTNKVASAANIEYHARLISQKYIQRELITVSTKIIRDAFEDTTDVFELLEIVGGAPVTIAAGFRQI